SSALPNTARRRDFLVLVLCLVAVLSILFHKSFEPEQIVFSNDGPLGPNRAQAEYALSHFRGYWQNLNWLGLEYPGFFCDVSGFLMASLCTVSPDFGPVLFAKIYAPVGVFLLGVSAWFLFRQLRFRPWVCVLGGLAAALNGTAFSSACWGLANWPLAWAMNWFAISALVTPSIRHWPLKAALAGFAVGIGVMEGFDVGAIFSLFTAAFAFLRGMTADEAPGKKAVNSFALVAVMALCAGWIAAQTVSSLIGTQVKGIVGMAQDEASKKQRWNDATVWSLPKAETLRFVIPGLFGYRMPELYGEQPQSANGSNYWGAVGQAQGSFRHSASGYSVGVLVALVSLWAMAQSFRSGNSVFPTQERRSIWCWIALLVVALFLAWGKHAPFYQIAYALPYFSTIRNPVKFIFPFSLALLTLFGYGLEGLCRLYLDKAAAKTKAWREQIKQWWKTAPRFDKKWTIGSLSAVAASVLGWLIYASSKRELVRHLLNAGFPDEGLAESIARFSLTEVGWFILFLALSIALLTLILSGVFSGPRARWAWITLGLLLVIDLGRADAPWIVFWNYKEKYASNTIIDRLRERPYEHRVAAKIAPLSSTFLVDPRDEQANRFIQVYFVEWLQHHFQYYRVQSLDIIQMPRVAEFDLAYLQALAPTNSNQLYRCGRLWQLTNCRYLLGMSGLLNQLNEQFDPSQHRFRVQTNFDLVARPGITEVTKPEHLTAAPAANGKFALFEFAGALPRVKLFARWQVNTNDDSTLEELRNPNFDPGQTVFVAGQLPPAAGPTTSTNQTAGTVEFARYEPKRIQLNADAAAPCVLLLNDRFHPDWKVWVDGKPETLLRCNYIMRGVYLTTGKHNVEFRFQPPLTAFYVSLSALIAGLALWTLLFVTGEEPVPVPAKGGAGASKK
ncbi:MAG TPA: hypothetical protein VEL06_13640, partial [Haliangiales bacterium]|nr:hypothetical protein [Haliangiales bacterium]